MGDHGMGEAETARALELAEGYLKDAENVLWEASSQADSPERAADLEELTGEIWEIEHAIEDLKRDLRGERETEEEPTPFNAEG
ncbi:MAG: hypothetical protein ACI8XM_001273 [Haloarculaceae archaeon]|jgi:hypothetical protein